MRQRVVALLAVIAVTTVAALAMSVMGQTTASAQSGQTTLKTPWGQPDLQGIWARDSDVPLQRPRKYKDQEFFTDQQVAELDKIRAARPGNETRAARGTEQDVAGAYNGVFLTRRNTGRRTSLIVDPADGRIPPLTPAVQQRNQEWREIQLAHLEATDTCKNKMPGCEGGKYTGVPSPRMSEPYKYYPNLAHNRFNRADGPEDHGLGMRCLESNLPEFLGDATGGVVTITQSPGAVAIFYDVHQGGAWHRTIPVDASPHLPSSIRLWWGDSRGHWEGDTLVVDVTNFSGKTNFQGSTDNLHLIERWRRTGPTTIEYAATMDDPTTWTRPWTVKMEITKQDDQKNRSYKEPRCVEGNYSIFGWLAGARAKEQAFAAGRGPNPATIDYTVITGSANSLAVAAGEEDADPFAGGE
jgi:hypothetical protein